MGKTILATQEDCQDFVRGCAIMGAGGGGTPGRGLQLLFEALEQGYEVGWVDAEQIPDDAWTASSFIMGSSAPDSEDHRNEMGRIGLRPDEGAFDGQALCRCVEEFAQFARVGLGALIPLELGGSNSVYPLVLAARLGLRCVDGDYVGRAVPEIVQTTPVLADRAVTPICSIDRWGDVCFIKAAHGPQMAERIGKMLSVAAFSGCLMTGFLLRGRDMKALVVPQTLGRCLELGRVIRRAREICSDPVTAIVDCTSGCLLFEGEVLKKEWEDREGYMIGTTFLKGLGRFAGHTMDVWFKNENHVAWKDGEPLVTSPDVIALVELGTGEPKVNKAVERGARMAVIGVAGPPNWRTPHGLAALGPRHFGFDIEYVPVGKTM